MFREIFPGTEKILRILKTGRGIGKMMSAIGGRKMRSYLIIICLILLLTPAVAGAEVPAVTAITPAFGANSSTIAITNLAGANFTTGATVMLTPVTVNPVHKGSISNGAGGALLSSPQSVFVSGNYAYLASSGSNALEIVDITNPAAPVHTGSISNGAGGALLSSPQSVFVSGNYAYVASYISSALEIVDITNPAAPVHTGSLSNAYLSNPQGVFVSGNYAYVVSSGSSNALEIVDITNPAAPVHTGSISNPTAYLLNPKSVFVSGNYAYIASSGSNVMEIVDVTDPAHPVRKSSSATIFSPSSVYVSGNYAYVTSYSSNALVIVDVTNPAAPVLKGSISNAYLNNPQSVVVSGNYAYVASYGSNALEIVNVTNPAAPVHKGSISNGAGGALLSNPNGVFVSGNYAYVASYGSNALEIVDIGTVTATGVNVVSANKITCSFNLINKGTGTYNVVVINPDGKFGTLPGGFTINSGPVANFYGSPLSGVAPLTVTFTDTSTRNPTSWNWSFGDGSSENHTQQNPVHTYSQGGGYTVSLSVTNDEGTGTLTQPDYVIVNGTKIGIFRTTTGDWKLDFNNTGVVDKAFRFGMSGDTPLVGDWDGDGTSDAAVFRPSNGNWYLNFFKDSIVDKSFRFGTIGDTPLVGDWNGDGTTDIGVFRRSTGNWILETTKTGVVYKRIPFGTIGDVPVTGDWNGDGTTDIGVYRPSTGNWILETTKTGVVYKRFRFGTTADTPLVGDWNGDGTSDAAVFRLSTGNWILETTQTGVVYKRIHFGSSMDSPKTGIWITGKLVPAAPDANFTNATPRTGVVPLTVQFTDVSLTNTRLTYAWDFNNDGTVDSTAKNPSFVFTTVGNYSVNLTVRNSAGSDTEVKINFVTVNPPPSAPVAAFTADPVSGTAPLTVEFTSESTGTPPLTHAWDFGDGNTSSSENPSHVYASVGTYSVNLTVTNSAGNDTLLRTDYITVSLPAAPVAGFSGSPLTGPAPLTVTFTDTSTGTISSRSWQYKNTTVDWTQFSTSQNPSYDFPAVGMYDIRLNVTGPGGLDTHTEPGYITATEP